MFGLQSRHQRDTPGLGGPEPAGDDRVRAVRPGPAAQPPAGSLRARRCRSQPVRVRPWPTRWALLGLALAVAAPALLLLGVLIEQQFLIVPLNDPSRGWSGHIWDVDRRGILMEWTPPPDGIAVCQGGGVTNPRRRRRPWNRLTSSGSIWRSAAFNFTVLGRTVRSRFRRKVSRERLLYILGAQQRCVVAMEACASAHYWGREILKLGHDVRLVPPIGLPPISGPSA